jgi:hypothetical protein
MKITENAGAYNLDKSDMIDGVGKGNGERRERERE